MYIFCISVLLPCAELVEAGTVRFPPDLATFSPSPGLNRTGVVGTLVLGGKGERQ